MQPGCLFLLPFPAKKPLFFSEIGFSFRSGDHSGDRTGERTGGGIGSVVAAFTGDNGGSDQDHYAVLGIRRSATGAEIKRAYRILAREHHPDVSRDQHANEVFKKIHLAYEVLSDEVKRSSYNLNYDFPDISGHPRIYKSEELRQKMQNNRYNNKYASWSYQAETYQATTSHEREPFVEVLRFAFCALFFMRTFGCRASLTLCGISSLLDKQLDAGYKLGYVIAWLLGGRSGIFLILCLCFSSWLCGKTSSSIVALVVIAMWIGANLATFVHIPQGAVLTLLYMSMKLQHDSKETR